ncbi:hypothetical protein FNF27_03221 [Cafeteria roenbergensis]|uniref:Aspartate-semialdehyde dehydrogenase n=2 Tax=Cafeteria roenbergensis TaxID=33653 RepID=A0A5A8DH76_CAFRO|nr:hypothetical protein FNF31_02254 [Cafeteria roenbergensis]KAA0169139.1 hypothetical protein FNF28_02265 [Cafeteria roenbergensis]KAA0175213.1 hypothetical protein FNF27_03221 [Cafeteria roenbergensis]
MAAWARTAVRAASVLAGAAGAAALTGTAHAAAAGPGASHDGVGPAPSPGQPAISGKAAGFADLAPPRRLRVGVLGATGAVGQRFIHHLEGHPWFDVVALGASRRSSGKAYGNAVHWTLDGDVPAAVASHTVRNCEPSEFGDVDFVFSALDASVAGTIEANFVSAGVPVFSNARNSRMVPNVPLVVPPVNPDHLDVVRSQRSFADSGAFIVTNANCSTTGLVCALEPIERAFGIEAAIVTTMQAISGAGYPGLSALDMLDNVIPRIGGEEAKLELEYRKILGGVNSTGTGFTDAVFPLSASANRVHVRDGHMICVSLKLRTKASPGEVEAALAGFVPRDAVVARLPSAPPAFVQVSAGGGDADRPQPRLDRDVGGGYTTVVGRVRECPVMDVKLVVCSHNTVMGAAGSSILNAELAVAKKLLRSRVGGPVASAGDRV